MTSRPCLQGLIVLAAALAFLGFAAPPAHASVFTWDGGGGNGLWATVNNWDVGGSDPVTPPTSADTASFAGTAPGTVTGSGTMSVGVIQFSASGYTISGGTLALGGTAPQIQQTAAVSGTNTISSAITSTAALSVDVQAGQLNLNGLINAAGAVNLTKSGAGTLSLGIAQTYTGTTTISGGTLAVGTTNAINSAGGTTIVNAGGTLSIGPGILQVLSGKASGGNPYTSLTMNGGTVSGAGTLSISAAGGNDPSITSTGGGLISVATLNIGGVSGETAAKNITISI